MKVDLLRPALIEFTFNEAVADADLVLVGDGSGTKMDTPGGFSVVMYMPKIHDALLLTGSLSHCSNNIAELTPYIFALNLYQGKTSKKDSKVRLFSDSEITVRMGNGQYKPSKHVGLWQSIFWFREFGYDMRWKYLPRNSNPVLREMDRVSRAMRNMHEREQESLQ